MSRYSAADFQADMAGPDPRMEELAYLEARVSSADDLLAQDEPLAGTIYTQQGPLEVTQAIAAFGVGTVLHRFGTWVVTDEGIACLAHHFPLSHAQLQEH